MTPHHHAGLRQLSTDPTNTEGIREQFLRAVRRRFRQLRGRIRTVAGYGEDRLNLKQDARLADAEDIERFPTDTGKTRAFIDWLRDRLESGVLEPVSRKQIRDGEHWTATYIRSAYARGWENATQRLQNEGVSVAESDREVFDLGVPAEQLRRLYARTFENLASVTEDAAPAVRETLTQGLAEGWNPRKMADFMSETIRTVQHTQAEVLARTEVINSYADATLDRFDRAGVDGATVSGEFRTAEDQDVCPICEALNGRVYTTDEMRTATFEFDADEHPNTVPSDSGVYPVKPPTHPRCRCAVYPSIS